MAEYVKIATTKPISVGSNIKCGFDRRDRSYSECSISKGITLTNWAYVHQAAALPYRFLLSKFFAIIAVQGTYTKQIKKSCGITFKF